MLDIERASILIVEDNALIALDLEYLLQNLGVGFVAIATTTQQALDLIAGKSYDAVLLDVYIGDKTTLEVAVALSKANIPFAYATGSDVKASLPAEYQTRPLILKPYQVMMLEQVLKILLSADETR